MKTLQGKLTIGRPTPGDTVTVTVEDDLSSCVAISIAVPLPAFAEALMGMGYQPCEFSINTSGVVGKTREHKCEMVPFHRGDDPDGPEADEAVAPFEVDGWTGYRPDLRNPHCREGECMRVLFERWVAAEETP